ncbi:hypothetical protein LEMLEM_LOCUS11839, partial [Lemmus lemmus]
QSYRAQGTLWKRRQKECKWQGMEHTKKTRPSKTNIIKAPMNSRRLKRHAQDLHGSVPGLVLLPEKAISVWK